jgi:hypothetical protein
MLTRRRKPNRYSIAFFQALWIVLKEDIIKVLHDFHDRGKFEGSLDATFITLISKIMLNYYLSQKFKLIRMVI